MKPIERKIYTERIKGFFDTELVKVITGVRRSGKSEILKLLRLMALEKTDEKHIIFINFEDADYDGISSYKELNDFVAKNMSDDGKYYIFLDEIQLVKDWEKSVNSLRLRNTDIYITGSNSNLLAGELATLLAGRYVLFNIQTLTFSEFIHFRQEKGIQSPDLDTELEQFIAIGGFPILSTKKFTESEGRQIVIDINSSAVLKDVVRRNSVRDVPLLEKILAYLYDNVGNLVSINKIVNYLKSQKCSADFEKISSYVRFFEQACIIKKAQRYDIRGKRLLESNDKYYLADHSLQYALRDRKRSTLPGILENIVFNELISRGYNVYIGKTDDKEIDFVAEKTNAGERIYVQVCTEFNSDSTIEREFKPLCAISDHHHKYVVTLDRYFNENYDGVKGVHLKDFLLKQDL